MELKSVEDTSWLQLFIKNSRHPLLTATPFCSRREGDHIKGAYLIPKLRYYFAEFLHPSYLKRLRILSSPTCVGFGYGFLQPEA